MWSVALVLFALLLVVALGGWLGERYLLPGQKNTRSQIAEDTCRNHGVWLCEECFPLDEWGIPTVR